MYILLALCILFISLILYRWKGVSIGLSSLYSGIQEHFSQGTLDIPVIPKIIWSYWDQGIQNAPYVVKRCVKNWSRISPGWEVRMLDKTSVYQYLHSTDFRISTRKYNMQKKSDIIRLCLLEKYGGVWLDSSIFLTESLEWIHTKQKKHHSSLIMYYIPGKFTNEAFPVLENWFIAASPKQPFIQAWKTDFQEYLDIGYDAYMNIIKKEGINLQNIDDTHYLTMHVSAQRILQKHPEKATQLYSNSAYTSPFYYHDKVNWDKDGLLNVLTHEEYSPHTTSICMIKLRGDDRSSLDKRLKQHHPSPKSVVGKYLAI